MENELKELLIENFEKVKDITCRFMDFTINEVRNGTSIRALEKDEFFEKLNKEFDEASSKVDNIMEILKKIEDLELK